MSKERIDVLLTSPFWGELEGSIPRTIKSTQVGLSYIKAYLNRVGISSKVIDPYGQQMGLEDTLSLISSFDTNVYGISATYKDIFGLEKLATAIKRKNPKAVIVSGGWSSFCYQDLLKDIPALNFVIVGQGELTAQELFPAILKKRWQDIPQIQGVAFRFVRDGKIIFTGKKQGISTLDDLLPPDFSDSPPFELRGRKILNYYSSRGCPYNTCKFCCVGLMHESYLTMSPKKIAEEVKSVYDRTPFDLLSFSDDLFDLERVPAILESFDKIGIPRRVIVLAQSSARNVCENERVLRDAVIHQRISRIDMGIETFSKSGLRFFAKPSNPQMNWHAVEVVNDTETPSFAYTIIDRTLDEIADTKRFYVSPLFWPMNIHMNSLVVIPYTKLAVEGTKTQPQQWRVAFQQMMRLFHERRQPLVDLAHYYDKGLKGQREKALQDSEFAKKYRHFEQKAQAVRMRVQGIVERHFDDALRFAEEVQTGKYTPKSEEFRTFLDSYGKEMSRKIQEVLDFTTKP